MKKHGHRHTPGKIESKRKQFRYGYYCIIIIDVQCCCCGKCNTHSSICIAYIYEILSQISTIPKLGWCNQFFSICCIALVHCTRYSVCIFLFILQQNHYLGIVRNTNNNKSLFITNECWMITSTHPTIAHFVATISIISLFLFLFLAAIQSRSLCLSIFYSISSELNDTLNRCHYK